MAPTAGEEPSARESPDTNYIAVVPAAETDPNRIDWSARPVPKSGGPTDIMLELTVLDFRVSNTDGAEFLQVKFAMVFFWFDPRVVEAGLDVVDQTTVPSAIWKPLICFNTNFSFGKDKDGTDDPLPQPGWASKNPGELFIRTETQTTNVDFGLAGDESRFQSFPFDSIRVDFQMCFSGDKRLDLTKDVRLHWGRYDAVIRAAAVAQAKGHPSPSDTPTRGQLFWQGSREAGEFACDGVTFGVGVHGSLATGNEYVDAIWSLHISRIPTYYIFKGAVPLWAIVGFALLQYALPPSELAERFHYLVSLMLTLFAVQWTVTDRLPRVSYLTALDRLVFACLAALSLMALGSVVAARAGEGLDLDYEHDFGYGTAHASDTSAAGGMYPDPIVRNIDIGFFCAVMCLFALFHYDIARRVARFTAKSGAGRTWGEGVLSWIRPCAGRIWYLDLTVMADVAAFGWGGAAGGSGSTGGKEGGKAPAKRRRRSLLRRASLREGLLGDALPGRGQNSQRQDSEGAQNARGIVQAVDVSKA